MKKGLNASQLKIIAILAMVCDHAAWGFMEILSVPGQILHVIGRLTIPIMCFFIAEGYRKTGNLKKYINRMILFAAISAVPFYLYFHEEYGYRQNIIFDYLLALLTLSIVASKKLSKPVKVVLTVLIFVISAMIGGWVILPICYVLIFYYKKSFREKAVWMAGATVLMESILISAILINNQLHLVETDWTIWYQWLYLLGFVLALPLLACYNGEKGHLPVGRYFFYVFYPCHFLVLYAIKLYAEGELYRIYFGAHLFSLVVIVAIVIQLALSRPSRPQIASVFLCSGGVVYMAGFVLEIMTPYLEFAYAGVIVEYFGEAIILFGFLWFMSELCRRPLPLPIYVAAAVIALTIVYLVTTAPGNHIFYTNIMMDAEAQPFHRLVLDYGVGFWIFIAFAGLITSITMIIGVISALRTRGMDRKRIITVLVAVTFPWINSLIRALDITKGYEIEAPGILCTTLFVYIAIVAYGYFDSVQLAGENALHHFRDGVLVVNDMYNALYINKSMQVLFPLLEKDADCQKVDKISGMLKGEITTFEQDGKIYDVSIMTLEEHGYIQGYMLCTRDMTEHYQHLRETERFAHTDSLTGLSNRNYFKTCFHEFRHLDGCGCMLMFDLDNFKGVNDNHGHGVGDQVLKIMATTLTAAAKDTHLTCRIGGDEFCMFLKDQTEKENIAKICQSMIDDFSERLKKASIADITSISIGAAILNNINDVDDEEDFRTIYKKADEALYKAKNSGKKTYQFYGSAK